MTQLYKTRIVDCGDYVEVYRYQHPIMRGFKRRGDDPMRKPYDPMAERREDAVMRAKKRLFRLVQCNSRKVRPLFLTLTYVENMCSRGQAINDTRLFLRIMKERLPEMKYLYVLETQERGAYHIHMLIFGEYFIPYEEINKIWQDIIGGGRTDIKTTVDSQHVAFYLAKYFAKDAQNVTINKRLFSCSLNLAKPDIIYNFLQIYVKTNSMRLVFEDVRFIPERNTTVLIRMYKKET